MRQASIKNTDIQNPSIRCLVWGMGNYYQSRKGWIPDSYNILAFIHGDSKFSGTSFEGKPVISPAQINEYEYDLILIAVLQEGQLVKQLAALKVPGEKIQKLGITSDVIYTGQDALPANRPGLHLHYFDFPNIGDLLNAFMLDKLFQVKVIQAKSQDADMLAIGSILEVVFPDKEDGKELDTDSMKKPALHIWGTGFIHGQPPERKVLRPLKIHALRGRLTRDCLSKILGYKINCVLADPGLLASLLWPCAEKKYDLGIVPHYKDYGENIFYDMQQHYHNAVVINVQENPIKVLQQISQCKCIISTSLHGLIIADSYGIPNQWCVYTDRVAGGGFKFRDYYSSFNLEIEPYKLKEYVYPDTNEIVQNYAIPKESVRIKQEELVECFPKELM